MRNKETTCPWALKEIICPWTLKLQELNGKLKNIDLETQKTILEKKNCLKDKLSELDKKQTLLENAIDANQIVNDDMFIKSILEDQ